MLQRNWISRSLFLLSSLSTLFVVTQEPQNAMIQNAQRAETVAPPSNVGARVMLDCQVFCSRIHPGTSAAKITWKAAEVSLKPQLLEARLGQQGLDATVYQDGFSRGAYARLLPVTQTQKFLLQNSDEENAPRQRRIPGLDKLVVTAIRPLSEKTRNQRFELLDTEGPKDEQTSLVGVQVEGLEPGLNYFWRVSLRGQGQAETSEVIRCQAPVCPVDLHRSPTVPTPKTQ